MFLQGGIADLINKYVLVRLNSIKFIQSIIFCIVSKNKKSMSRTVI